MTKRKLYNLALTQPIEWLKSNLKNPSPYQRPIHLAIIRLAIRNLELGKGL
jgi:hypothetical protein